MLKQLTGIECLSHPIRHIEEQDNYVLFMFDHGYLGYTTMDEYDTGEIRPMDIDTVVQMIGEKAIALDIVTKEEYRRFIEEHEQKQRDHRRKLADHRREFARVQELRKARASGQPGS